MNLRKFLVVSAGIGSLVTSATAIQTLSAFGQNDSPAPQSISATAAQNPDEAKDLARRVAGYILEKKEGGLKLDVRYSLLHGLTRVEYVDRTTGEDISNKINKIYESGPKRLLTLDEFAKASPNVLMRYFRKELILIDNNNIQASAEVKVYYKNNNPQGSINWDDPNNQLVILWFEPDSRWTHFTDRKIDGIFDECSNPFMRNKQEAYIEHLKRFDRLYTQ